MGAPKRCPSFSQRPDFPCGLRVLLVDSDPAARARTEEQLRECSYTVTSCASCAEAVVQISSCTSAAFDVLLADSSAIGCAALAAAGNGRSGLLDSCKGVPCILMAAEPSPEDVMRGIALGAVDFLAKPLSQLKLRNIWQHTVRKMMSDMQIGCSAGANKAAVPPLALQQSLPAAPLDRSGSNTAEMAAEQQQQQQRAGSVPGKPPTGMPPRSPPLRAVRVGGTPQHRSLHACTSSTDLRKPATAPMEEEPEFDFEAAAAVECQDTPAPPAAAATAAAAPTTSGATAATATATHMSMPGPSCGVPAVAASGALAPGMCWGMPMPIIRAPGIVPPKGTAPGPAPAAGVPPPWAYNMGCPPMPPMGYMAAPPSYMMPGMCGGPYPGAPFPPPYPGTTPPAPWGAAPPQQRAPATGAAVAQALDASLMSLLGSAEDDSDLDADLEDVLGDLEGSGRRAAAAAAVSDDAAAASPRRGVGKGYATSAAGVAAAAAAAAVDATGSPLSGSLGSSQGALPRVDSAALLTGADDDDCADGDAFLGTCRGGLGALDDWAEHLSLKKSASLADLLSGPLAVA